jgi:solute carrier family 45 protein 1/2/4
LVSYFDQSFFSSKKSRFELARLSSIIPGIEFAYAAETAFVSPILLEIGIDHTSMSFIWGISPLLGLFLAPLMASISDRCNLKMGRRRPFIIALGCGVILGLILVPHSASIVSYLGIGEDSKKWAVFLTILGIFLLDFDAENCQTMSRAYFLDVCVTG